MLKCQQSSQLADFPPRPECLEETARRAKCRCEGRIRKGTAGATSETVGKLRKGATGVVSEPAGKKDRFSTYAAEDE